MTTPDKIYAVVLNGHITMAWSDRREDKTDIEYIRVDVHHAELDALHAECDRLTAILAPQKQKWMTYEEVTETGAYCRPNQSAGGVRCKSKKAKYICAETAKKPES